MALAGAVAIDAERGEQDATVMANRDGTMMSGRPETADLGMKNVSKLNSNLGVSRNI